MSSAARQRADRASDRECSGLSLTEGSVERRSGTEFKAIKKYIVSEMSPEHRLLIVLWYAEGMNPPEIAEVMGLTPLHVERMHAEAVEAIRASAPAPAA